MESKAIIYAEKIALVDVLERAFDDDNLDNIVEVFRRHATVCINMDDLEVKEVFRPESFDNIDILCTLFNAFGMKEPVALKRYIDGLRETEDSVLSQPNALFLRDCSKEEANAIREKYGVWVLNSEEMSNNRLFESFSFGDSFEPRVKYGSGNNGWASIISQNKLVVPPSNSLVIYDNHLLDTKKNDIIVGLANLIHLLDAFLPQNLDANMTYYILVMCPGTNNEGYMTRVVEKWKDDVLAYLKRQYTIAIEFVFSKQVIHERILFMNHAYIKTEKGFKVFFPYSNEALKDGEEINSVEMNMYLSNPQKAGETKYKYASTRINKIKAEYKLARENYDNNVSIIGVTKFVGSPLTKSEYPNRIFD